jgi:hypothetical protein
MWRAHFRHFLAQDGNGRKSEDEQNAQGGIPQNRA